MAFFVATAKRLPFICLLVALIVSALKFSSITLHPVRSSSRYLQRVVLEKWLQQDHIFIPASSSAIEFVGRWSPGADGSRRDASFPGSRASFEVRNSTSVLLSFNNVGIVDHSHDAESHNGHKRLLAVYPDFDDHAPANPTLIRLIVNDQTFLLDRTSQRLVRIGDHSDRTKPFQITLEHLGGNMNRGGTTEFEGIWLSKGSRLIPQGSKQNHLSERVLEIYTSVSTLPKHPYTLPDRAGNMVDISAFPRLLQSNPLYNTTVTAFSTPLFVCTISKCRTIPLNHSDLLTAQELYFRSGPPNTIHFKRPWSYFPRSFAPTAIVLELGYWDFSAFLSDVGHRNKQAIDTFTALFVDDYVKFILTIRRVLSQARDSTSVQHNDASFIYNSQPSTMPIFLMSPPLPSIHDRLLSTALFNALHRIIISLQRIEGDTKTFFIDTSGWLDSNDFINSEVKSSDGFHSSISPTEEIRNTVIPIPTRHGHAKIALHMAYHLCPYLHPNAGFEQGTQTCPFDNHEFYLGNLYLPDEGTMAKLLQERKVQRVKAMFNPELNPSGS